MQYLFGRYENAKMMEINMEQTLNKVSETKTNWSKELWGFLWQITVGKDDYDAQRSSLW